MTDKTIQTGETLQKTCTKCGVTSDISAFPMKLRGKYGVAGQCRLCRNADRLARRIANHAYELEYSRAYTATHLEEKRERSRLHSRELRAADPEAVNARNREWRIAKCGSEAEYWRLYRAEHPEKIKGIANKYARRRRVEDPEGVNADRRAWRKANPDKVVAEVHRRRSRKLASFVEDVFLSVLMERDSGVCGICALPIVTPPDDDRYKASIDHIIPLSKGGEHSYANTQPAHLICNLRKGAKLPEAA